METINTAPDTEPFPSVMGMGYLVACVTDAAASRAEQSRAFGEIVRRFQDMAFACSYALLGDTHLAEDAAQEAFLTAWKNIDDLREPDAFPGWFRSIVRTQCCRMTRGRRPSTISLDSLPPLLAAPASQDPLLAAVRSQQEAAIRRAIIGLPEHERVATVLYYLGAWDQKEIAAFLEVPATTVKKRLFSARRRLRERIAPIMFPDEPSADNAVRTALPADLPSRTRNFADTVALWTAIDTNDAPAVHELLTRDPSLSKISHKSGEKPLHIACAWGHTESALALLQHDADPNEVRPVDGATPLHALAAGSVRLEILEALLSAGARPDSKDGAGRTAVQIAALRSVPLDEADADSFAFAEHLLDHGAAIDLWTAAALDRAGAIPALSADVNGWNSQGDAPLHVAARSGYRQVLKALIDAGAEVEAENAAGLTPLRIAVQPGRDRCCRKNASAASLLKERGARTDIFIAALTGDLEELAAFVSSDATLLNARDIDGATPLCLAAWNRQKEAVAWLLGQGADINIRDNRGRGPASVRYSPDEVAPDVIDFLLGQGAALDLRAALALGRAAAAEALLLENPAQLNAELQEWAVENIRDASLTTLLFSSQSPANLFQAAALGANELITELIDEDPAALHRRDRRRQTPLHIAAERGHKDTVALLLSRGASPDATAGDGGSPLHRAAGDGPSEIISLLLTGGAKADVRNFRGETPLFGAVAGGNVEAIRLLLRAGASVQTVATGHRTPLHAAAVQGNPSVVRLLVEQGADLHGKNHWGATPLHLAVREGHAEAVSFLLNAGADRTVRDNWYRTPLHLAVWFGQTAMAELLLDSGASVSELSYGYSTPLHTAAGAGQVPTAVVLLARGADVNYPTDFKRTPLHDAVQNGSVEMVSLLLAHGANPSAANDRGMTPLHWAAAGGKSEIAVRLREAGADIGLRSGKKETARDLALRHGNVELADLLI